MMFKLTYDVLFKSGINNVLLELGGYKLPGKISYKIIKFNQVLSKEIEFFRTLYQTQLKLYTTLDEQGNPLHEMMPQYDGEVMPMMEPAKPMHDEEGKPVVDSDGKPVMEPAIQKMRPNLDRPIFKTPEEGEVFKKEMSAAGAVEFEIKHMPFTIEECAVILERTELTAPEVLTLELVCEAEQAAKPTLKVVAP